MKNPNTKHVTIRNRDMQKGYRIEVISLDQTPLSVLEGCASLYCEIWREPPWNEDFWTTEIVLQELKEELARGQSRGFLALPTDPKSNDAIIGFTWGYRVSMEDMQNISGTSQMDRFFENGEVFYIDELGVDSNCRLKGAGRELSECLLEWAIKTGHETILLRTDLRAEPARALYKGLGFVELDVIDANEHQRSYWVLEL
ncbi:MAG: GNAT family N-acetyltransferase [Candidatus Buchananbacteria bacterium]